MQYIYCFFACQKRSCTMSEVSPRALTWYNFRQKFYSTNTCAKVYRSMPVNQYAARLYDKEFFQLVHALKFWPKYIKTIFPFINLVIFARNF